MSGNSRIRTTAVGTRVERIATETHIFYEPRSQDANIVFQGEEYMTNPEGTAVYDKLEGRAALALSLSAIATKTYDAGIDPVTGADLSQVSPAGIAAIIRAVYNSEHNLVVGGDASSLDAYLAEPSAPSEG